jgi:hypothetical protein
MVSSRRAANFDSRFPSQTAEFQAAVDTAVQHMQKILLAIKKSKPDDNLKAEVKQAFGFQMAYLKANFDRFHQAL